MTSATAEEWQSAKQKVRSWIDHEERCVTTQRIALAMNFSRLEASQLLGEIAKESDAAKFQINTCQRETSTEDSTPVTIFRLRQSTTAGNADTSNLVALAPLQSTESLATAHERDLLEWREMVADGRHKELTKMDLTIEPAEAVAPLKDVPAPRANKLTPVEDSSATRPASSNLSSNRHKAFSGKDKKVTTAASFFGNKSKKSTSAETTSAPSNGKLTATSNNNHNSSGSSAATNSKAPQPTRAKENKVRANQVAPADTVASNNNKKKNSTGSKPKSFGNADDFLADEEESDDEEEVKARQQKKAARRKVVEEAARQSEEAMVDEQSGGNEDDDDDDKAKVVGAMDAFATEAPKKAAEATTNASGRQRKRRKKLVEETVNVNGYLRTETKAVWEDVPTDEEEEEKEQERQFMAKKASFKQSRPPKSQQGMKQKSLMGFFAKK